MKSYTLSNLSQVIDKLYLNPCTEFAMQIIKIKIKVFERKIGFSEIKKAL